MTAVPTSVMPLEGTVARTLPNAAKLGILAVAVTVLAAAHLGLGVRDVSWVQVWQALTAFDPTEPAHAAVHTFRLPRMLTALSVGAASAMAGALVQGLTGNPVAAPDILGVNAGGVLAVVIATTFVGIGSPDALVWIAFLGAAIAGAVVYAIGTARGLGSAMARLVLAGAAVSALLAALSMVVLILSQETFEQMRFWLAGSTAATSLPNYVAVLPYFVAGLVGALLLSGPLATLALGTDVARGLGQRVALTRLTVAAVVVLLAAASVSVAGPIAFVGLVAPHVARFVIGFDPRWTIPCAGLVGSTMLLAADLSARVLLAPREIPVGIVTAVIGAPVFIALVRRRIP
jgi:iron complex transport system permease protein